MRGTDEWRRRRKEEEGDSSASSSPFLWVAVVK